jgi:hypothetical protein
MKLKHLFISSALLLNLSSCNYSITMIHTEGQASDVVDETDTLTPSTNISLPISTPALPL